MKKINLLPAKAPLRSLVAVVACLGLSSGIAQTNECSAAIELIDQQFTSTNPLPGTLLLQAKQLRDKGTAQCEAGLVSEGLATLEEAKVLLGLKKEVP